MHPKPISRAPDTTVSWLVLVIGPLCVSLWNFVLIAPHNSPSRVKRGQGYWQPAKTSAGISTGGAPWLVQRRGPVSHDRNQRRVLGSSLFGVIRRNRLTVRRDVEGTGRKARLKQ
jgi:hypothetical protein